jgi:hypothetical protein
MFLAIAYVCSRIIRILKRSGRERQDSSQLRRYESHLRLRQLVHYAKHAARDEDRYLQRLPSVLHGQAEVYRHGRPHREVSEEVRRHRLCQSQSRQESRCRAGRGRSGEFVIFTVRGLKCDIFHPSEKCRTINRVRDKKTLRGGWRAFSPRREAFRFLTA